MKYKRKHEHGTNHLEVMCRMQPGEQYTLTWQWRYDNDRDHWKRAAKKGYFKKHSSRGTDTFTRTNKAFIEGDTLKRSIAFSWPDIGLAPKHIQAIIKNQTNQTMKNILTAALLLCSTTINAQTLSTTVAAKHGVVPSYECDGTNNVWCLHEGEPVKTYNLTAHGLKSALDDWSLLSVKLRESYGEPVVLVRDVEIPSYVDGLQDYVNMNMATRVGSGWVEFTRLYETPAGKFVVALVLNEETYMVAILTK